MELTDFEYRWLTGTDVSDVLIADMNELMKQLTGLPSNLQVSRVSEVLEQTNVRTLCAFDARERVPANERRLVGLATFVKVYALAGRFAWIKDVIVHERVRKLEIERNLVVMLCDYAKSVGLRHVEITSAPAFGDANRLFNNLGFARLSRSVFGRDLGEAAVSGSDGDKAKAPAHFMEEL